MSTVTSVSGYNYGTYASAASGTQRRQRPDPSEMAENLFSQLDTTGKGYIEESDLESALSGLSSASSTGSVSASDIFSQIDTDSDGKVTKDELSTGIAKLAEELDSQFNQTRMEGAMPPPPPPADDEGFTQDELSSQLEEIGSTDSVRSSLISSIVENFDAADTNSDGKVSFQEAMAYDKADSTTSSSTSDTSSSSDSSGSSSTSQTTDAQIFRQIMELMRSYGNDSSEKSTLSSLVSTAA